MRSSAMWSRLLAVWADSGSMPRSVVCALFALALFAAAGSLRAQTGLEKISGEVVALDGVQLRVKSEGETVRSIELADKLRLSARSAADPAQLKAGAFVGTTAVAQPDGTLLAREVHIFPESMRGSGEGHRPMDTEPGSTMTNATIATVGDQNHRSGGTSSDATVADVSASAHARRLTLSYKGGEKTVVVPEGVPIVMVEPADRALLAPGAHVVVFAARQADGSLVAERVTVGKNGFVPPL